MKITTIKVSIILLTVCLISCEKKSSQDIQENEYGVQAVSKKNNDANLIENKNEMLSVKPVKLPESKTKPAPLVQIKL